MDHSQWNRRAERIKKARGILFSEEVTNVNIKVNEIVLECSSDY
jgi:hypothetical protein